jgi:hypothetical protein
MFWMLSRANLNSREEASAMINDRGSHGENLPTNYKQ